MFGKFDLMSDQKTMRTSCLSGFFHYLVTKTFTYYHKKYDFCTQKWPNLAQNLHFWSFWAKYWHFLPILSENNLIKMPWWVFRYMGKKTFDFFCPKTTIFGFFVHFGLGLAAHLVPCWWIGWWLWRVGCISQDTDLLYIF